MAKRLGINPVYYPAQTSGASLSEGSITITQTGTSTKVPVYTDSAAVANHPNPVPLSITSKFPIVWLNGSDGSGGEFRYVTSDSDDAVIFTQDKVPVLGGLVKLNSELDVNGKSIISSSSGDITFTPFSGYRISLNGMKWIDDNIAVGQLLGTDGTNVTWYSNSLNIVEDLTPQLGGDLDGNSYYIQMDSGTGITDDAGNEQLLFSANTAATSYLQIANAATGHSPSITVAGDETHIGLALNVSGSGTIKIANFIYPTSDGSGSTVYLTTDANYGLYFSDLSQYQASQANMESASSNVLGVSPGRLQYHPGVAKAWASGLSGSFSGYNVTSLVKTGDTYKATFTTAMSSTTYCPIVGFRGGSAHDVWWFRPKTLDATYVEFEFYGAGGGVMTGESAVFLVVFGDQ